MKEELILKHKGLIIQVMKDLHCIIRNQDDFDDYFFIGLTGLLRGLRNYDETKGKSTYLYLCIKTALTNEFKRRNTIIKKSYKTISLNYQLADEIELIDTIATESFEDELITKIYVHDALDKLKNKKYKQCLIEYYGIDCPALSMPKIAQKYGITPQCVRSYIQRGLELLRKELKNDNFEQIKN